MSDLSIHSDPYEAELEQRRWPEGPRCPHCDADRPWWCASKPCYRCRSCRRKFTVTSRTVLHSLKLPAEKLLRLRLELARGTHAYGIEKAVGVGYKTATSHIRTREQTLALLGDDR